MNVAVSEQQVVEVALPMELFQKLQAEAESKQQAAATVAQQAIESWLKQKRAEAVEAAIAAYVERHAGTDVDLDEDLAEASLEVLSNCDDEDYVIELPSAKGAAK